MKTNILFLCFPLVLILLTFNPTQGATVTVTSTGTGAGSFNAAIAWVNDNSATAPHTIVFDNSLAGQILPAAGTTFTTNLTCPNVTIDGTTMAGYSCGNPRVMINCNAFNGWQWTGSSCTIRGVRINGGIQLNGTGGHTVEGCVFNINFDGTVMTQSAKGAVRTNIATTTNNKIGGFTACERNIVAASGAYAIVFDNCGSGNRILGNYLGTNATGTTTVGTGFTNNIIHIASGSGTIIDRNLLTSSGSQRGIYLNGAGTGCEVLNNLIGTDITGVAPLGTGLTGASSHGIHVNNSSNVTVDGNTVTRCNRGILIEGTSPNAKIANNNVGAGANRLFHADFGIIGTPIFFNGNGVGGGLVEGNVSGNTSLVGGFAEGANMVINNSSAHGFTFRDNYVGVDIAYNKAGAAWCGIFVRGNDHTITGNIVGDNGIRNVTQYSHGIGTEGSNNVTITNNYVGVSPTGINIGNGDHGIEINGGAGFVVSGNIVGFNQGLRTTKGGGIATVNSASSGTIENNFVGLTPDGANAGNAEYGIMLERTTAVTVRSNKIAYNTLDGIHLNPSGGGSSNANNIFITENCIWCNGARGIGFADASQNSGYGRSYSTSYGSQTSITVNAVGAGATNSNISGDPWIFRGFAPAGSIVEVFKLDECNGCATPNQQGETFLATVTTDVNGLWTWSTPANTVKTGIVVTASEAGATPKKTSEFSTCVSLPNCERPQSLAIDQSPGPIVVCPEGDVEITASYTLNYFTSCVPGSNYYFTWFKDGSEIYGPSLIYSNLNINDISSGEEGVYTIRVEDGNAGNPSCYREASISVVLDDPVNCGTVPVNLLSFNGKSFGSYNELSWSTASEFQNKHFEIQRSADGRGFYSIGVVQGGGNSSQKLDYIFQDHQVGFNSYYYRLKQVDLDNSYTFSSIIYLDVSENFSVNIYPVPAEEYLHVKVITLEGDLEIVLTDVHGKEIFHKHFTGKQFLEETLDIQGLPNAVYILKVQRSDGKTIVQKVVKN